MILTLVMLLSAGFSAAAIPSGTYQKPCAAFEEDDFITASLSFGSDGDFLRSRTAYEEEGCTTPWIKFVEKAHVDQFAGEELNLRFQKAAYRPLTAEVAEALRLAAFCGITDWRAQELRDVTGRECGDFYVPKENAAVYSRVKLDEKGLWWGAEDEAHDGRTPARRPVRFESLPFQPAKR